MDLVTRDLTDKLTLLENKIDIKLQTKEDVFNFMCDQEEFYDIFWILGTEGEETICESIIIEYFTDLIKKFDKKHHTLI